MPVSLRCQFRIGTVPELPPERHPPILVFQRVGGTLGRKVGIDSDVVGPCIQEPFPVEDAVGVMRHIAATRVLRLTPGVLAKDITRGSVTDRRNCPVAVALALSQDSVDPRNENKQLVGVVPAFVAGTAVVIVRCPREVIDNAVARIHPDGVRAVFRSHQGRPQHEAENHQCNQNLPVHGFPLFFRSLSVKLERS